MSPAKLMSGALIVVFASMLLTTAWAQRVYCHAGSDCQYDSSGGATNTSANQCGGGSGEQSVAKPLVKSSAKKSHHGKRAIPS
jgi:hypothetical protein